jgi:hypothetical protein
VVAEGKRGVASPEQEAGAVQADLASGLVDEVLAESFDLESDFDSDFESDFESDFDSDLESDFDSDLESDLDSLVPEPPFDAAVLDERLSVL